MHKSLRRNALPYLQLVDTTFITPKSGSTTQILITVLLIQLRMLVRDVSIWF